MTKRDDELRQLVHSYRRRAKLFGDDDEKARRVANMCADELEEILDERGSDD